jgi:hypothetical protein
MPLEYFQDRSTGVAKGHYTINSSSILIKSFLCAGTSILPYYSRANAELGPNCSEDKIFLWPALGH